eukprot:TRINITY_DN8871_c0_g1_i1.p1 TRINITY_DN8871_c0_g1~~TRINITY_DN8871_c0_g1_i1.p1  ORF type:complete len:268 (+),score=68.63 TRINITY_DN8871_c0_g1_i1:27-830(+)
MATITEFTQGQLDLLRSTVSAAAQSPTLAQNSYVKAATAFLAQAPMLDSRSFITQLLRVFAWVVMDVTFESEQSVVEHEFPEGSASKVTEITQQLESRVTAARTLCALCNDAELDMGTASTVVHGTDLAELLFWRKGALKYMFAKTQLDRGELVDITVLQDSIVDLRLFRAVQQKKQQQSKGVPIGEGGEQVAQLVSKDIYSDTHMLSVAYEAELCFVLWKRYKLDEYLPKAREVILLYIAVADGPLAGTGWDTTGMQAMLAQCEAQ